MTLSPAKLVLSLFPGIGLLDKAFEDEGFCVVRGPDVIWGGDIRTWHPPSGKFDGIIGGPPCQMFSSLARLVEANGHKTRFGNLIPEFERCVTEAQPDWFVMENVPQAPVPVVAGYGITPIVLDNSALLGDNTDGMGQEQRRVRRFSFGLRGRDAPNLARWIDLAVFLLPDAARTVSCTWNGDKPNERKPAVTSSDGGERPSEKHRTTAVSSGHEQPDGLTERKTRKRTVTKLGPDHLQGLAESTQRKRHETINGGHDRAPSARVKTITSSKGGTGKLQQTEGRPNNGRGRYKLADALRLQGLPEDFLDDCPFTKDGALKAVANGVPVMMGRAIARAVKEALS